LELQNADVAVLLEKMGPDRLLDAVLTALAKSGKSEGLHVYDSQLTIGICIIQVHR
jgi:hypothetical protein